jgi:hypothetical protein
MNPSSTNDPRKGLANINAENGHAADFGIHGFDNMRSRLSLKTVHGRIRSASHAAGRLLLSKGRKMCAASGTARQLQIAITVLAVAAIGGVVVAQSPVTTIPGPAVVTGPLTITDGQALIGTEMNSFPMASFVSSPDDALGRKGRVTLYRSTATISSNLHFDTAQNKFVADNPSAMGVVASTQGDNFEVWQLPPGGTDLVQVFGVYPNGIGMYTRQPQYPLDIRSDVGITGNLYINGVQVMPGGCGQ